MQYLTLTYPGAWPFTACDYDLATRGECVIPGVYAIVGAAAGLAGVTRTTSKFQEKREGVLCIHVTFFFSFFSSDHVWTDLFFDIRISKYKPLLLFDLSLD